MEGLKNNSMSLVFGDDEILVVFLNIFDHALCCVESE